MIAEFECGFCNLFICQKIPDQYFRIGIISGFQPMYLMALPFQFPEENILPFGKLTDFIEQLSTHLLKSMFALQVKRDFPVFQAE